MSKEPVLAGFYPDPSVCRVGEQYYLVNSSFEYFPAVPVHRSADLLTWTPVGAVFDDPAPFRVVAQDGASGGFYAPTIRYHDGMFWVVTTSIGDVDRGHVLVRASDPGGPWDAPVFVAGAVGIDPDLVWTEDGTCWLTWKDQLGRITQAQL
ncbi:family 43 glycosylhydrolase, partial [Phytoactinopolyspora endophytica]|uniref:family 43 glycosylhydrolase n=1 Tax=Phytoactinopolyspora endophytica TaxID=1642495 RepID=UPI00197B2E00